MDHTQDIGYSEEEINFEKIEIPSASEPQFYPEYGNQRL
jgi:hypothetical protein